MLVVQHLVKVEVLVLLGAAHVLPWVTQEETRAHVGAVGSVSLLEAGRDDKRCFLNLLRPECLPMFVFPDGLFWG